jgi:energy-coupling factor transporter ATP-binding protein EcfA2
MPDARLLLDLYDRVVAAAADGVVPDDAVERAAEVGRAARRRLGYLGDTVVVALAGGTGSGKSSLLNAIAGEEVSPSGAQRPTTSEPVAWIPTNPEPGLTRLLDDLGVTRRVGHDDHPWLALIDLPDTDSVVDDHRMLVDRILPLVDAVVWVVDPEKYQDARLHRDQLRPRADRGDRYVFALNQIDRVPVEAVDEMLDDLRVSLNADGIAAARIVATAGDPVDGLTVGLDSLLDQIRGLGSTAGVVRRRITEELAASADELLEHVQGSTGSGLTARWTAVRDEVADIVERELDLGARDAAARVARDDAAAVTGWIGGRSPAGEVIWHDAAVSSQAARPLRTLVDELGRPLEPATRAELVAVADGFETELAAVTAAVAATTSVALPPPPAWWSRVRVLSWGLAAVAILGVAVVVDGILGDGAVVPGVLLVLLALTGLSGSRAAVRRGSERRVAAAMAGHRGAIRAAIVSELERRIGRRLRDVLRPRSQLGAAHSEFMLAVRRDEET